MKKLIIALLIFSSFLCQNCYAEATSFLTEDEILIGADILSLPPQPNEAAFYNDKLRYEWGKTMRNTERGKQALEDSAHTLEYFSKIYSEPFSETISQNNTPEITTLITRLLETTYLCCKKAKNRIMRIRPFIQFNEHTPMPEHEEKLKNNSSYPSGHTIMGWTIALVLAEINPERQNEILKRGFEYGENRVIIGVHFQSDVDDARLIASILVNRLHANDDFMKQLKKAKEEFLSKKALQN